MSLRSSLLSAPHLCLSIEIKPALRNCKECLKSVVLHEEVGPVGYCRLAGAPMCVAPWANSSGSVSELFCCRYVNNEMSRRSSWSRPGWALMPSGGCSLALVVVITCSSAETTHEGHHCSAVGLPCHIHPHAWAPLTVASAPLHAGNKAHRKCTQSECSALHCCHSFCPQGDHCSVQQPSRPLLLGEHPDLQQCGGNKNITGGPGAYQAVSTSLTPLPPWASRERLQETQVHCKPS